MKNKLFDRQSALEYASKWAFSRNPNYYNFDNIGGDCTNFVSQCLFAGSKIMNYTPTLGWYYNSLNDRAPAWTGVEFLYKFLINNNGLGPFAELTNKESIAPGDVVQLGSSSNLFYHSLIVTNIENDEIYVSTHTTDSFNRNLNTYFYATARFIKIKGVRY